MGGEGGLHTPQTTCAHPATDHAGVRAAIFCPPSARSPLSPPAPSAPTPGGSAARNLRQASSNRSHALSSNRSPSPIRPAPSAAAAFSDASSWLTHGSRLAIAPSYPPPPPPPPPLSPHIAVTATRSRARSTSGEDPAATSPPAKAIACCASPAASLALPHPHVRSTDSACISAVAGVNSDGPSSSAAASLKDLAAASNRCRWHKSVMLDSVLQYYNMIDSILQYHPQVVGDDRLRITTSPAGGR